MFSVVCADIVAKAQAIVLLHPDIINSEPTELIGSGNVSDMSYVMEAIRAVKVIDPAIMVEQDAEITTAQQIYDFIVARSEAAGATSDILNSPDPEALLDEMVYYVKKKDVVKVPLW